MVHADHQYIVPTDGKPLRGLIQDHVVSGILLTKKDTTLTRQQYMQLVYAACTVWTKGGGQAEHMQLEPPAMLKPRVLWTGKQVGGRRGSAALTPGGVEMEVRIGHQPSSTMECAVRD